MMVEDYEHDINLIFFLSYKYGRKPCIPVHIYGFTAF
jgi:hypothetical protein